MKPEYYDTEICGATVRIVLDHATAHDIVTAAGKTPPKIPSGYNTVTMMFRLDDGTPAMCVNQRGFERIASDNEHEVNGCLVLLLRGHDQTPDDEFHGQFISAMLTLSSSSMSIEKAPS
jgi:hypothetical protein